MSRTYMDNRGWMYRVMEEIGGTCYKGCYSWPGRGSWHGLWQLPWRETREEAEADLDRLAAERGWTVWMEATEV